MSLTYKQLRPILYKMALKAANYKYDVDELVNEVWLRGNVQHLTDIRLAGRRIKFDIIDYFRSQEGRAITGNGKPSSKYRVFTKSYNQETDFSDDGEHREYQMFLGAEDEDLKEVDYQDELNHYTRTICNDPRDRLVVRLRLKGYSQKEIAEKIGLSESRISQILTSIGKIMLAKKPMLTTEKVA